MKIVQTKINNSHYKQLDMSSLAVDNVLKSHIFIKKDKDYVIIIEAGTLLTLKLYEMLKTKDALYTLKEKRRKQKYTKLSLFKSIQECKNNDDKSLRLLYEVNNSLFTKFLSSDDDIIDTECMNEIIKSLVHLVKENVNYVKDVMQYFSSDYSLPYHSIHVSLYAIHLGHFLQLNNAQLVQLGIAGLLHDIGIKKIDESIKNKDSKLDLNELESIQQHTKYSGEIAQKNYIHDPYILDAIIHHHEAHDGSGYPHHLSSKDIKVLASIICISDSFDALTNDRSYRKRYSTFEALKIMMQDEDIANKFHPKYLKTLLQSFTK